MEFIKKNALKVKNSYWLSSSILSIGQKGITIALSFFSFYFLVRILPKSYFGTWSLYLSIITFLELSKTQFYKIGFIKFYIDDYKNKRDELLTSALAFISLLTLVYIFINIILYFTVDLIFSAKNLNILFLYGIIYLMATSTSSFFSTIEQANFKYNYFTIGSILGQLSYLIFIIIFFSYEIVPKLYYLIIIQSINIFITSILGYFITKKYIKLSKSINYKIINHLFSYGKYTFGISLSSSITKATDQIMLGALLNTSSVALLSVANRITRLFDVPIQGLAYIFLPKGTEIYELKGKAGIKLLYTKSTTILTLLLLLPILFLMIYPKIVITIIAGEQYQDAAILLRIALSYILLIPFIRQFGVLMNSIGKIRINLFVTILINIINIIMNYLLIKTIGVSGAPLATLFSFLIAAIITIQYMSKNYEISLKDYINEIKNIVYKIKFFFRN